MGRGRKAKGINTALSWQQFYNNNVGTYLQIIITELGKLKSTNNESGVELLKKIKVEKDALGIKENYLDIENSDIPFIIPKNWTWCRLNQICSKIGSGSTPKGSNYSIDGFPFFRSQNIHNENLVYDDIKFVSAEVQNQMKGTTVLANDILLNITGGSLGRCAMVPLDFEKGNVSQHVCIIRLLQVEQSFFHKFFLSLYFQKLIFSSTTGSGREGLPKYNLENFLIPLPPLSEQKIIMEFLNDLGKNDLKLGRYFNDAVEQKILSLHVSQLAASELISENNIQLALIENLNQTILQEAVQGKLVEQNIDDEPASELLKRIKTEKERLGKKEKLLPQIKPDEIPFEIPESWAWCRLGDICSTISDIDHSMPRAVKQGGVKFLSAKDLKDNGTINYTDDIKFISEVDFARLGRKIIPQRNDIIYSRIGAKLGKARIVHSDEKFIVSYSCCTIRTLNPNIVFLNFLLDSGFVLKQATGNTTMNSIPDLGMQKIKEFLIPLPPLPEQKRIVDEIGKQLAKTKQLKEHVTANQQATEQLLKALLHQAFEVEEDKKEVDEQLPAKVIEYQPKNFNYNELYAEPTAIYAKAETAATNSLLTVDLEAAIIIAQIERKLNLNYGEVAMQKTFFNLSAFNHGLIKRYYFKNSNFGTYSPKLKSDLKANSFLSKTIIKDKEVFEIKPIYKKEIAEAITNPANKDFVNAVNDMLCIYSLPFINKETDKIELLNTVTKMMIDLKTVDLEKIYGGMQSWCISQAGFQTKADKFSKTDTKKMIELMKGNGLVERLF